MSNFNRNDCMIAVTNKGHVFVAQGSNSQKILEVRDDLNDTEFNLFYSQLKHHGVFKEEGKYRIGTVTEARKHGVWLFIGNPTNMTGAPAYLGQLNEK